MKDREISHSENKRRSDASTRHWGIWYLSISSPLSLNLYPYLNSEPYEITLDRLNQEGKILNWLNHFAASKAWNITFEDVRDFLRACRSLASDGSIPNANYLKPEDFSQAYWGY